MRATRPISLLSEIKADGWLGLFGRYRRQLRGYIANIVRSPQEVDDLVQETFLHVWTRDAKGHIGSPRAYLFQTARHVAIDSLRERRMREHQSPLDEYSEQQMQPVPASEQSVAASQQLERLLGVVGCLPPQCRKVFLYRKVHGLPYKEIAERMGLSVRTVENHIARAMRDCRWLLEEDR